MSAPAELWRAVPGFAGLTDVSTLGRARRWYRLERVQRGWHFFALREPELVRINSGANGRAVLPLWRGRVRPAMALHRAVLLAFLGPCPEGFESCHFPDRDPLNCALDNLRWDSRNANAADTLAHRTCGPAIIQARLDLLRQRHPHLRSSVSGIVFVPQDRDSRSDPLDVMLGLTVAGRASTPLACSTQNATTAREPGAVLAMGGGGCSLAEVRR